MIKRTHILAILTLWMVSWATVAAQTNDLQRATPESQGVPSKAVTAFFDSIMSLKTTEIHSALLMRHGKVIGEIHPKPFAAEYGHTLFSCSKTFLSAAVGIAIDENRLRVNDRLATFFPELLPDTISPWLAKMTVEDLLTMQSGIKPNGTIRTTEREWVRKYLALPVETEPGSHFAYDSMCTYLLSAILSKVTGTSAFEYLRTRLLDPLHIKQVNWEYSPENITTGGWGLYLQTESLAKFGQLLLSKGNWKGKQIISPTWVKQMMTPHAETGKDKYCYQMWECAHPNTARADGAYGQYIIVMPDEEMVAVITQSATGKAGAKEQQFLFRNLLPTLHSEPLTEGKDYKSLTKKTANYQLPYANGKAGSALSKRYEGKHYSLATNTLGWKGFSFEQQGKELTLTIDSEENGTTTIPCGYKTWTQSQVPITFPPNARRSTVNSYSGFATPFIAASSYAWNTSSQLEVKTLFVDWMSGISLSIHFDGKDSYMEVKINYEKEPFTVAFHE